MKREDDALTRFLTGPWAPLLVILLGCLFLVVFHHTYPAPAICSTEQSSRYCVD